MTEKEIQKLKRNNQELQEIIDNSWDGIGIIDSNSKLIYVNNAFTPLLGYKKNELVQKSFVSFMKNEYKKSFLELLINNFKEKKYKAEINIACTRKDNEKVFLKVTISSMLNTNLFVINTKDITTEISDSKILDDYVISMHMDLHGYITKISKAFLKLFSYEESEITGKHYSIITHESTEKVIYENIDNYLKNNEEWSGKLKCKKKDSSSFWINLTIKPIYNKYGDITGYTSLMFDLTNEINLNEEANILQESVKKAKKEIEEKDNILIQQSKLSIMNETLQRLSHEWRQPLNLISIQTQKLELDYTLKDEIDKEESIQALKNIKKQADDLSQTIENFQDFLKPKYEKELNKPSNLIQQAITIVKNKFGKSIEKNIEIKIENDIEFYTITNDFITVLVNLISNAKEAIDKVAYDGIIQIKQDIKNDNMIFRIIDNGLGIENKIKHKIFEPYFSTKEIKQNVGLGLYTSKIIVNIHLNGIISVDIEDNKTEFKISIPIELQ